MFPELGMFRSEFVAVNLKKFFIHEPQPKDDVLVSGEDPDENGNPYGADIKKTLNSCSPIDAPEVEHVLVRAAVPVGVVGIVVRGIEDAQISAELARRAVAEAR